MTGMVGGLFGQGAGDAATSATSSVADAAGSPWITGLASAGQGILQLASSRQKVAGLDQQRQAALVAAGQADFAASQEELAGRASAVQVQQQLAKTLAAQNARYAGAGIALDTGTPATVAGATTDEGNAQLAITRGNATIRAGDQTIRAQQMRQQAALLKQKSDLASASGWLNFGGTLFDYADKALSRTPGSVTTPGSGSLGGF